MYNIHSREPKSITTEMHFSNFESLLHTYVYLLNIRTCFNYTYTQLTIWSTRNIIMWLDSSLRIQYGIQNECNELVLPRCSTSDHHGITASIYLSQNGRNATQLNSTQLNSVYESTCGVSECLQKLSFSMIKTLNKLSFEHQPGETFKF